MSEGDVVCLMVTHLLESLDRESFLLGFYIRDHSIPAAQTSSIQLRHLPEWCSIPASEVAPSPQVKQPKITKGQATVGYSLVLYTFVEDGESGQARPARMVRVMGRDRAGLASTASPRPVTACTVVCFTISTN